MDIEHFTRSLVSGRGDIVLYLQTHAAAPYRDALLRACLHNVAFDPMSNGDRYDYLYDLIQLTSEPQSFRDHILAALPTADIEDYSRQQLYGLAGRFAANGDEEARRLMYDTWAATIETAEGTPGDGEIIELDGLQGFLFVADKLGALVLRDNATDEIDHMPLFHLGEVVSEDDMPATLEQATADNANIAAYVAAVRQQEAEEKRERREFNESQWDKQRSFAELEAMLAKNSGKIRFSTAHAWARNATNEDFQQAAEAFLREKDPQRQESLMRLFEHRDFPLDPAQLVALAHDEDYDTAYAAMKVLKRIEHPAVRALALELLDVPNRQFLAVELLVKNHEDGDESCIERVALSSFSNDQWHHWFGQGARDVFDKHPKPENVPVLIALYQREACAYCRGWDVNALMELDAVPEWMIAEMLHDGDPDNREAMREYVAARGST